MPVRRIIAAIEWLSRALIGIAFAVMMAAVLIQVLGRSVLLDSPVWTEELTRFALLFLAALGTGLSFRSGDMVNVDLVCEQMPGRWPWRLRLVSAAATAVLAAALVEPAWRYMNIGAMQTSPALGWKMNWIHASMLLMILSLLLFAALRVIAMLAGKSDGRPQHTVGDAE